MKRVQMILEDWQADWLAKEAEQENTSMSALLRQLLGEAIERRQLGDWADDPLWGIVGLGAGPQDGITSANLDEYLYRVDWRNQAMLKVADNDSDDR